MKRDPNLVSLSHDHHVTLVVAMRLERATARELDQTVAAATAFLAADGERHFALEEELLLDLVPEDARAERERMLHEHGLIREQARELRGRPDIAGAQRLGVLLREHVRFEERELFPLIERTADPAALARVGARLAAA